MTSAWVERSHWSECPAASGQCSLGAKQHWLIKWRASKCGRTKSCNRSEATSQRQSRVEAGRLGRGGGRSPRPLSCKGAELSSRSGLPASRAPAPPLPRSLFCPVRRRGNREGAQTHTLARLPHLPYTFSYLVIRVLTPAPRPSQKTAVEQQAWLCFPCLSLQPSV